MIEKIAQEIKIILMDDYGVTESDIYPDAKMKDMGLDSLDSVELSMNVETHFNIHMADRDYERIETYWELVSYVNDQIENRAPVRN